MTKFKLFKNNLFDFIQKKKIKTNKILGISCFKILISCKKFRKAIIVYYGIKKLGSKT